MNDIVRHGYRLRHRWRRLSGHATVNWWAVYRPDKTCWGNVMSLTEAEWLVAALHKRDQEERTGWLDRITGEGGPVRHSPAGSDGG